MKKFLRLKQLLVHQRGITHSLPSLCKSRLEDRSLKSEFYRPPVSLARGRYLVTMISGAGIGPELMEYVIDIFRHLTVPIDFEYITVKSMKDVKNAIISIKRNKTAIQSNIEHVSKITTNNASPNITMRQNLDLYLNVVHCKPYCLENSRHNDVDIVLIRQNTEGEYAMLEHESVKGVIETMKIITRSNSERVAKRAFEFATIHNRKKVTVVHKANIMKLSDGLFLEQARKVGKLFPNIQQEAMLVDNCCMQLVTQPKQFDILIMPNLYGSIIANIMCGILGGPGLFAGGNYGEQYAVFEPATRNMGTDLAGKNRANPVAMLNASVGLLNHLGLSKFASLLDRSIFKTVCQDKIHTPDLGGKHTSMDVVKGVKENIELIKREDDKIVEK